VLLSTGEMSQESSCLELKAVASFLSQVSNFHLQVADPQTPTANPYPTKAHLLHRAQARFYEILKQQLALLSQHLNGLEIQDLQDDLLENLGKVSRMIC
jgi:hypothetical protein